MGCGKLLTLGMLRLTEHWWHSGSHVTLRSTYSTYAESGGYAGLLLSIYIRDLNLTGMHPWELDQFKGEMRSSFDQDE